MNRANHEWDSINIFSSAWKSQRFLHVRSIFGPAHSYLVTLVRDVLAVEFLIDPVAVSVVPAQESVLCPPLVPVLKSEGTTETWEAAVETRSQNVHCTRVVTLRSTK